MEDFLEGDFLEEDFLEEDFLEEDFLEGEFLEGEFLEAAGLLRISSLITIFTGSSPALEDDCSEALLGVVVNSRKDFLL